MSAPGNAKPTAFVAGLKAGLSSVFIYVLIGTYVSIGALAHDYGFSLAWVVLSTILMWAGPAQVILITALGAGAAPVEVGIAVGLSGMRLLPMVVSLLPLVRSPRTGPGGLVLTGHLTAVSMWIEALRLAPALPREERLPFVNGIGGAFLACSLVATVAGYYLAGILPVLLVAALLFLTPMSFLVSVIRNSRVTSDRLAIVFGLLLGPMLALEKAGLDLLWTGLIGGTAAYGIDRLRRAIR